MTYDDKKIKLRRYLVCVDKLKARCREAELWEPFALPGGISGTRRGSQRRSAGLDTITATAETIQQEVEELAGRVNGLRRELTEAIAQMPTERYRSLLDLMYISGVSLADASGQLGYATRYCRRLLVQAIDELDASSAYFGMYH